MALLSIFSDFFPKEKYKVPYKDHNEYLEDNFKVVEMMFTKYWISICGLVGAEKDLYFERMEIKEFLDYDKEEILKSFKNSKIFIASRISPERQRCFAGEILKGTYHLSDFEWFCVVFSTMLRINDRFSQLFQKVSGFFNKKFVDYAVLLQVFYFVHDVFCVENYYDILSDTRYRMDALFFDSGTLDLSDRLYEFLMSDAQKKLLIPGAGVYVPSAEQKNIKLAVREKIATEIINFLNQKSNNGVHFICIYGKPGIGKRTLAKRVSEKTQEAMVVVDIACCSVEVLLAACRECTLNKGYLCVNNFDLLDKNDEKSKQMMDFVFSRAVDYVEVIFLLSNKQKLSPQTRSERFTEVELEDLTSSENRILWDKYLSDIRDVTDVEACEMANKFSFTPAQIKGTILKATNTLAARKSDKLSLKDMCESAYSQVASNLSEKAVRVKSKHTWDDLILNAREKEMLKHACTQVKYKHVIYDEWCMGKRVLYGRGVSMLFAGPPGTGKTMAAGVVANDLGLEIYRVDLSQIVSKYIGETEKNLNVIFEEAKCSNVILFFDETDALFGKRTEVKDSHDKNANIETSYLLQKMEEYEGITVMTTNFLGNIDNAFFRRISYVIHFEFPDKEARKKIWQNIYPKEVPMAGDIDFNYLARQFEIAGGNIKNIALTSLFIAVQSEKKILEMSHILMAMKYELTKQGKTLLRDDFSEYAYLVDGNC
jgi:SpoVK/Ycf46/Vps4 family AAA+-type ATPase